MIQENSFFENCKKCERCGRPLPNDYRFKVCASCEDIELFDQVRDYIRENDVNELDVAEHFHISRRKVHAWIREGRIQYKDEGNKISYVRCRGCGTKIAFGEYCKDCMRKGTGTVIMKDQSGGKPWII